MSESQLEQILAQQRDTGIIDVDEPMIKLVIFRLAEQYFAFVGSAIKEILPGTETVFFVPGMPSSVEGVINVRGDIESVIQLHSLLQLPYTLEKNSLSSSSLLLAHGQQIQSALRVDQLLDVVDVMASLVQPIPEAFPEHLQAYVSGLLELNGLVVALLNIDTVLYAWQQGQG